MGYDKNTNDFNCVFADWTVTFWPLFSCQSEGYLETIEPSKNQGRWTKLPYSVQRLHKRDRPDLAGFVDELLY